MISYYTEIIVHRVTFFSIEFIYLTDIKYEYITIPSYVIILKSFLQWLAIQNIKEYLNLGRLTPNLHLKCVCIPWNGFHPLIMQTIAKSLDAVLKTANRKIENMNAKSVVKLCKLLMLECL